MRRIFRILVAVLSPTLLIAAAQGKGLKFRHQRMTKGYQSGFTLMEALLVAFFVAVIVGIAVPNIRVSLSLHRLTASADLVAAELTAGRILAISRNWLYEIDCDTNNNTIQIVDPDNSNNSPRTAKALESGITLSSIPASGSEIRFYSRGLARGGTIVLQNENGDTISILVGGSGRAEVQDFVEVVGGAGDDDGEDGEDGEDG